MRCRHRCSGTRPTPRVALQAMLAGTLGGRRGGAGLPSAPPDGVPCETGSFLNPLRRLKPRRWVSSKRRQLEACMCMHIYIYIYMYMCMYVFANFVCQCSLYFNLNAILVATNFGIIINIAIICVYTN